MKKICCTCKTEKIIKEFGKSSSHKDGLKPRCKECRQMEYQNSKEHIKDRNKKREDEIKEYNKQWQIKNREYVREKAKEYNSNNSEKINKRRREYTKNRREKDVNFKMVCDIRTLITGTFKRACKGQYKKSQRTEDILGCTILEFLTYLEALFVEGMSFENHGNCEKCWHIDHKIPISSAKTEEDIYKLNHYTNLQPLWITENLSKKNKIL